MSKLSRIIIFSMVLLTFLISVKLFWNMGVYVADKKARDRGFRGKLNG